MSNSIYKITDKLYYLSINFILISTYYLNICHYHIFSNIIKNTKVKLLDENEKLRLLRPKAQEKETTFKNHIGLMKYFANYIIKHNKTLFALIPFTERHYKILIKESAFLEVKTPVIDKIKQYLDESKDRYTNIEKSYTSLCADNDYNLHKLMCTTHIIPDYINRVFLYDNINMNHYINCEHCSDETLWFVNCKSKAENIQSKIDELHDYLLELNKITDINFYKKESEKELDFDILHNNMVDNIIKKCGCSIDEANKLIHSTKKEKIDLILKFLNLDETFIDAIKSTKQDLNDKTSKCPFT